MATYSFPSSLNSKINIQSSGQPFIHFMIGSWEVSQKTAQQPTSTMNVIDHIFLSIPETTLQEQFNHNWETGFDTSSLSGVGLSKAAKVAFEKARGLPLLGDMLDFGFKNQGILLNDFIAQSYKGLDFRQFEFLFNMIPKSLDEAENIQKIMISLKKNTTPLYKANLKITFPSVIKFKVYSGNGHKPLFQSTFCGVQSLGFNYSPSGFMRTFKDGNPCQIHMNISLKELRRVNTNELIGI